MRQSLGTQEVKMIKWSYLIAILLSITLIFCNKNTSPIEVEHEIDPPTKCWIQGLEIEFSDTCSYSFIITFLSEFDSVQISHTFLGHTYHFVADSGDSDYWFDYFENDSTIQFIGINNTSDTLQLEISVTGQRSFEEELQRFSNINHLVLVDIVEPQNKVYVIVPEDTESEWEKVFTKYDFILQVNIIGVCVF